MQMKFMSLTQPKIQQASNEILTVFSRLQSDWPSFLQVSDIFVCAAVLCSAGVQNLWVSLILKSSQSAEQEEAARHIHKVKLVPCKAECSESQAL